MDLMIHTLYFARIWLTREVLPLHPKIQSLVRYYYATRQWWIRPSRFRGEVFIQTYNVRTLGLPDPNLVNAVRLALTHLLVKSQVLYI